jgi:hypothetical protein
MRGRYERHRADRNPQKFSADLEVVVEGYETGLDPIHLVKQADITRNPGLCGSKGFEDWDGEYALAGEIPGHTENPRQAVAILGRRGHRRG